MSALPKTVTAGHLSQEVISLKVPEDPNAKYSKRSTLRSGHRYRFHQLQSHKMLIDDRTGSIAD